MSLTEVFEKYIHTLPTKRRQDNSLTKNQKLLEKNVLMRKEYSGPYKEVSQG